MVDGPCCKYTRWARLMRNGRYWYLRIIRQNATPENIAFGLAVGVFVGALPIIPLQSVTLLLLAYPLRINFFSAWLATCYSNVFTLVPFYSLLFLIGKACLPVGEITFNPNKLEMLQLIETGWDVFLVMLAGGVIFGIVTSLFTYFVSLQIIHRFRRRREARRSLRRSQD